MQTTLEQRHYLANLPNGNELKVEAWLPNKAKTSSCYLQGRKLWEQLTPETEIEVRALIRGRDKGLDVNTPIGMIETWGIIEKKEFDMTVKQYLNLIQKFHEEGHGYYNAI